MMLYQRGGTHGYYQKLFDDESEIDPENTTRTKKLLDGVKGEESKDRTRISIDIQDLHIP